MSQCVRVYDPNISIEFSICFLLICRSGTNQATRRRHEVQNFLANLGRGVPRRRLQRLVSRSFHTAAQTDSEYGYHDGDVRVGDPFANLLGQESQEVGRIKQDGFGLSEDKRAENWILFLKVIIGISSFLISFLHLSLFGTDIDYIFGTLALSIRSYKKFIVLLKRMPKTKPIYTIMSRRELVPLSPV